MVMRRAAVFAMIIAIGVCLRLTSLDGTILARLYSVPVVLAALYDGWRGGSLAALLSGATLLPLSADSLVEGAWLLGLALIIGFYADRERHQKSKFQELHTNFEGMKRAERLSAIGQLSAGLAHEIRNPLASIAGAASILRRNQPLDTKASKCLDIIDSECKRLNGLLTTFLNFARPTSRRSFSPCASIRFSIAS